MPFERMTPIEPTEDADGMPVLKVRTVAEHLGRSASTVRRLIRAGRLRAIRFGHLVRVREDDFWAYQTANAGD